MQFTLLTLFTVSALAAPTTLSSRQSSTTCGSNSYSSSQLSSAVSQGYNYYQEGQTVGSDGYPHQYKDYEGFNFPVSGPYQEFPVLESGAYSGGQPGADRVIFNEQGQYAGTITHTGASSYDGFVGCSGTS